MFNYSFTSVSEFAQIRNAIKSDLAFLCPEQAEQLFIALNEAVNNAIVHGNKYDKSKQVKVNLTKNENEVHIKVCDEGSGYRHHELFSCNDDWRCKETGRGLYIINGFLDNVRINETGNEIIMIKKI